ncbi:polysaccharide deacetylase family protein [Actinokineospora sp. UTMC 2448]|uniref:polysaccharide deacetylase family protein n=1 Tax=Actinokineospora sp. UTMC 2448 TaxID=2268449 RepID=UPI002164DA8A|nr:polysaccharide deacetylase family protein [Actinokineospora sp. UTMC 2448]UVS81912.1 Bifunctional xylanase/deacetylase precursor [Actinokineospora sp. UTMC 2448]
MPRKQFREALAVAFLAMAALAYPAQAAAKSCANGYVALTFDDGPNPATTLRLLAALEDADARATFFTVGRNIDANPHLQRVTQDAGMWIANHTYTHPNLTELSRQEVFSELVKTQVATVRVNRTWPTLFRPPYGATNAEIKAMAKRLGMTEVLWTVDSRDWAGVPSEEIRSRATALQPGGIILLHDGIQNTIDAVPLIVSDLAERGLCAGRVGVRDGQPVAVAP